MEDRCVISLSLVQARVIWKEKTSIETLLLSDWPVGKFVRAFS